MIDVRVHPDLINTVYLPYLEDNTRTQIIYGGSSSGKSVFLAQRVVIDIANGGRNYLVCRAVGRTVRKSVMNEIRKVIAAWKLNDYFEVNRSDGIITCKNGHQILFAGLDDPEKIKSITPEKGVITDIWIEEATETEHNTIKQLYKRQRGGSDDKPKRLTMSFNPILQSHWIYREYFSGVGWTDEQKSYKSDDLTILKTTYMDNRFLTEADKKDLEGEQDKYFRDVYTLGKWGILGNVIFTNWRVEDLGEMRAQFTNPRNGLDFGFSSDPAALAVMHYDRMRKTVYILDELYETGLTNDLLAGEVKARTNDTVTCDSAEPKSIAELSRYGISARAAKKGKDSVVHGIQWLQQQTIIVDASCVHTKQELEQYHWQEDRNGLAIRQPVDRNNHLIDAIRYGLEADMDDDWLLAGSDDDEA